MACYQEFEGQVVIVTGAAQGIGLAVCQHLLACKAIVVGLDIQFADDTIDSVASFNRVRLDITDPVHVDQIIRNVETTIGPVHGLVSVAGVLHMSPLTEMTVDDWQHTLNVNLHAAFYLCASVARFMKKRQRGVIVAVSSNAAQTPRMNMGAYAASKAGLTQMMKCLGLELASHNIRCNVVSPGSTLTPMQEQLWAHGGSAQQVIDGSLPSFRNGIPLKAIAKPENIAESVLFLLSQKSSNTTMANLVVDGGATLGHA